MGGLLARETGLTALERKFIAHATKGASRESLVVLCRGDEELFDRMVKNPFVISQIAVATLSQLHGVFAPRALAYLGDVIDNTEAPTALRVKAAESVLRFGGYGDRARAGAPGAASPDEDDISTLSASELRNRIANLERQVRGIAADEVVDVTPSHAQAYAQNSARPGELVDKERLDSMLYG